MKNSLKKLITLAMFSALFLMSGCAGGGLMGMYGMGGTSGAGILYTNTESPSVILAAHIDPTATAAKTASGSNVNILGLIVTGDASLQTIMQKGQISKIHHVDNSYRNVLGLYGKTTVTVYGE